MVINKEAVLIRSSQGPINHRPIASVIEVEMDVSMSWTARRQRETGWQGCVIVKWLMEGEAAEGDGLAWVV